MRSIGCSFPDGHRGTRVSRKRVERLMRALELPGLVPKRFRRTTIRVPGVA